MKIQIGEVYMDKVTDQKIPYPNKTKKYLLPCLREYGEIFAKRITDVFKVAIGIGDVIVDKCGIHYEKHLFILLDSSIAPIHFKEFIPWIRTQSCYEDDYAFGELQKSTFHMIILKFPERLYDSFETFKSGEYSKMFDLATVDAFFDRHPNAKRVLIKDRDYQFQFVKRLNKQFNSEVDPLEYNGELSFKPVLDEEIFNHHLKETI